MAFVQRIKRELGIDAGPLAFEPESKPAMHPTEVEAPFSPSKVLREIQEMSASFQIFQAAEVPLAQASSSAPEAEYAGAGFYQLSSKGSHPDGDLHGSEAMLCHKMLVAARDGKEDIETVSADDLKELLNMGVPVDRRRPFFMKREQEDVSVVAPANARRVHGMSALMYAAQGGYFRCCMHLLIARADANCEDEDTMDGMRPLHFAASSGNLSVCELLIQHRADVSASRLSQMRGKLRVTWCQMMPSPQQNTTTAGRSYCRQLQRHQTWMLKTLERR
eukprot:s621_g11.t1